MKWIIILLLLLLLWLLNSRYTKLGSIVAQLLRKKAYQLPDEIILDTARVPAANKNSLIQWFQDKGYIKKRSFELGTTAELHLLIKQGADSTRWIDLLTKGEDAVLASAQAKVELDGGQFDDVSFNYQLLFPEQRLPLPRLADLFKKCTKQKTTPRQQPTTQIDSTAQKDYSQRPQSTAPAGGRDRSACFKVVPVNYNAVQNDPNISYQGGTNLPAVHVALIDSRASFAGLGDIEVPANGDPYNNYLNTPTNDFDGMDFSSPEDHGTFMASLIASNYTDAAALKIRNYSCHDGQSGHLMEVICAILAAAQQGVDIINLSLGYAGDSADDHLRRAINFAAAKNVLVVCAAGNLNADNDLNAYWPANFSVLTNVLTVAATDPAGQLWNENQEVGSNFGQVTVPIAINAASIPGLIADGSKRTLSGTSCAAAKITAIAANIKSQNPGLSASELKSAVLSQIAPGGPIFPVPGPAMA